MTKPLNNKLIIIFLTLLTYNLVNAQTLINKAWAVSSGEPGQENVPISQWDDIDWTSSALTNDKELITVGNTLQSSGNTDILVTKYTKDGGIAWEKTIAGNAGRHDYGLVVKMDNSQNILVAGVVTTANQTTDIVVLKYSIDGDLFWSQILDGAIIYLMFRLI